MDKVGIEGYQVGVATALYHAGTTEDGTPYHAESYYVVLERADGYRLGHNCTFLGAVCHRNPEDGFCFFEDVRSEAKAKAEDIAARVVARGYVDMAYWAEVEAVYGSAYYCELHNF